MHEQTPQRRTSGNYPLPGTETFYHTTVKDVPRFTARQAYPWANGAPDGPKLFKIVHDNLLKHSVEIRLNSPAAQLVSDPETREMAQGDFVAAKSYLDQSLALVRGAGNRNSIAETLWLQGRLALRQNDFDPALYHFKESLALYRTYTTSVWVTRDLVYIAILHVARDQFTIAARLVGALDARDKAFGSINAHLDSRASIAEYQSAVENLRARMPAAAFDAEWKAGHGLTVEQSIELALS